MSQQLAPQHCQPHIFPFPHKPHNLQHARQSLSSWRTCRYRTGDIPTLQRRNLPELSISVIHVDTYQAHIPLWLCHIHIDTCPHGEREAAKPVILSFCSAMSWGSHPSLPMSPLIGEAPCSVFRTHSFFCIQKDIENKIRDCTMQQSVNEMRCHASAYEEDHSIFHIHKH